MVNKVNGFIGPGAWGLGHINKRPVKYVPGHSLALNFKDEGWPRLKIIGVKIAPSSVYL